MSSPQIGLKNVVRITATNIFFTPQHGATLDFNTVSSTPAAHREALQNNGLIAKICIGITIPPGDTQRQAEEVLYSAEGRLRLWRSLLTATELIDNDVIVPSALSKEVWPLLSEKEFDRRLQYYQSRRSCAEVNQSVSCAPILGITEGKVEEYGVLARICVVWMPQYSSNLISWTERHLNSGRWVPEQKLTTIVQQTSNSLLALSSLHSKFHGIQSFEMEDILVNEEDAESNFIASVSPLYNEETLTLAARDSGRQKLHYYPYIAPEQVSMEDLVPAASQKYAIWSLGMTVYFIASGTPSLAAYIKRIKKKRDTVPFNHPDVTPDQIVKCIRRDFESGGYSSAFCSLTALLLSTDPHSRPTLSTIDQMMMDLNRMMPVLRFPFTLGSFDILRHPDPRSVQLNLKARKYISADMCCACRCPRNTLHCRHGDHAPALCTPSWVSDEPLPGEMSTQNITATFLYPLSPILEEREQRRLLSHAISGVVDGTTTNNSALASVANSAVFPSETASSTDINILFQLFGGFALIDSANSSKKSTDPTSKSIVVNEILILYPRSGVRKSDAPNAPRQLHFSAALPWPTFCTAVLQKRGRITSPVPPIFGGASSSAKYFAWLLPGEKFVLENGKEWVPSEDGAFVFWHNNLLEPSDLDRYYPLTSLRALTIQQRVPRTTMPENVFRVHIDDSVRSTSHNDGSRSVTRTDGAAAGIGYSASRSGTTVDDTVRERSTSRNRPSIRRPQLRVSTFNEASSRAAHLTENSVSHGELEHALLKTEVQEVENDVRPTHPPIRSSVLRQIDANQLVATPSGRKDKMQDVSLESAGGELKVSHLSSFSGFSSTSPVPKIADAISALQLFGCWYSPDTVDVSFDSLTFWVPSTGEQGSCHSPVHVTESVREALRLPPTAMYMAFLSNSTPLLLRNHPRMRSSISKLLLPNNGLAFFSSNSSLMSVLALRCVVGTGMRPSHDEFRILFRRHSAISGTYQRFRASYFTQCTTPFTAGGVVPTSVASRMRHSAPTSLTRKSGRGDIIDDMSCVSASSRVSGDAANSLAPPVCTLWEDTVPISWMGFDSEQSTLVFTDSLQNPWYPISISAEA